MCIFFNMYDTLGEIFYRTIVQKISNIQRCQMEKVWKKSNTFLLSIDPTQHKKLPSITLWNERAEMMKNVRIADFI